MYSTTFNYIIGDGLTKLEEILSAWDKDTEIDRTELGEESRKIPKLHSKYLKMRAVENLKLVQLQSQLKELKLEKHEFYLMGPTKEQKDKGWQLPAKGMVLKSDLPMYMDADKDMVQMNLRVAYQNEIVFTLDTILGSLKNRNWEIGRAIDWAKFTAGA